MSDLGRFSFAMIIGLSLGAGNALTIAAIPTGSDAMTIIGISLIVMALVISVTCYFLQRGKGELVTTVADSLQTNAPLTDLRLKNEAHTLGWFEQLADSNDPTELDIDPPYQRGHVWGERRRQLLVWSIMQGIPIGSVVLNDRFGARFREYQPSEPSSPSRDWAFAVIDGKQRFTTLVMWLRSELRVPASWFPETEILKTEDTPDGPHVRLNSLAARQRRFFQNIPVSTVVAKVPTLAAEQEVFDLINFGGVAQGETDGEW